MVTKDFWKQFEKKIIKNSHDMKLQLDNNCHSEIFKSVTVLIPLTNLLECIRGKFGQFYVGVYKNISLNQNDPLINWIKVEFITGLSSILLARFERSADGKKFQVLFLSTSSSPWNGKSAVSEIFSNISFIWLSTSLLPYNFLFRTPFLIHCLLDLVLKRNHVLGITCPPFYPIIFLRNYP